MTLPSQSGTLTVEVRAARAWKPIGPALSAGGPPGTLSHNGCAFEQVGLLIHQLGEPLGRCIYEFECREDHAVVLRSLGGADRVSQDNRVRELTTTGFEEIARLDRFRREFVCWLTPDGHEEPRRFRFRYGE